MSDPLENNDSLDERRRLYYLDLLRQIWGRLGRREQPIPPANPLDETVARDLLARYQADARERMAALTEALTGSERAVGDWSHAMERELRLLHTVAAALGRGGFVALTEADVRLIGRMVEKQMGYINRWKQALAAPTPVNTDVARARAMQYAGAATETYSRAHVAALGLPELPQYPGDGHTQCLTGCRCHLRIEKREGNGNFDVWWIFAPEAQHCPDCPHLAEAWSPLEIRNGLYTIPK